MAYHPPEIALDEQQVAKLARFVEEIVQPARDKISDDDWDMMFGGVTPVSPLTFCLHTTGLGTEINVEALGFRTSLTICDDGEIVPDEWREDAPDWCKWEKG